MVILLFIFCFKNLDGNVSGSLLPNPCDVPASDVSRVTRPDLGETPAVSIGPMSSAAHGPVPSNQSPQADNDQGNTSTTTNGEDKVMDGQLRNIFNLLF